MKPLVSKSPLVCLSLLLLTACGPTPTTTSVAVLPTVTPTMVASATPTSTPIPTETPTPTQTATPTKTPEPTNTPTSTPIPPLARLAFFYDKNLNGRQDSDEVLLEGLDISSDGYYEILSDGSVMIPQGTTANLHVSGLAPNEKPLLNATFLEPNQVVMLPEFAFTVEDTDFLIGLADGYCTSPIKPQEMFWNEYNTMLGDPDRWWNHAKQFYPEDWRAKPNWYFYDYYNPGPGHLAFDIWAVPGTQVHASVPGEIVRGDFDHIVAIRGPYGKVDFNHIILSVSYGQTVQRGDVVGTIAPDQGNHVHMELRPSGEKILECFPGMGPEYLIVSPLDGKPVPVLPYFGP
jgi:hypothetical protein